MFNNIKRLFGEGKIRCKIICDDGSSGAVKVDYIGDIDTLDEEEFAEHVKKLCLVQHGKRVKEVIIIGAF